MILTPGLLTAAGFMIHPNATHCYVKENVRITFYGWDYMIISVENKKSIRGENITIERFMKEYGFSPV